jgi:hypothetical protein
VSTPSPVNGSIACAENVETAEETAAEFPAEIDSASAIASEPPLTFRGKPMAIFQGSAG